MSIEPCAVRGCETPLSEEPWHKSERGEHTRRPLHDVLDRLDRLERVFGAVFDLDRCVHGRHERDMCSGCSRSTLGASKNVGNAFADVTCGYGISGRVITPRDLHRLVAPDAPRTDGGTG